MSDQLDLNELRAIAEAATPGEWHQAETGVLGAREDWDLGKGPARIMVAQMPWRRERMEANAKHVATFDPPTVLALLSRVEKAERSCRLLGTIIERDGKNLVELTNSQDIIPEDGDGDWEVVWERAQEMKVRLEQAEHEARAAKSELQGVVNEAIHQKKRAIKAEQQVARVRAMAEEMGEAIGFDRLVHGSEAEYPVSYFRDKLEEALDGEQDG